MLAETKTLVQTATERNRRQEHQHQDDKSIKCHRSFKTSDYESQKDINPNRAEGTCGWVLEDPRFLEWYNKDQDDLLWISADPGCGKSVLSKALCDRDLSGSRARAVCYFFFKDNEIQESLATALCALLHQLFTHQPQLIEAAVSCWERIGEWMQQDLNELWRILIDAGTAMKSEPTICVLDALDECKETDREQMIIKLAEFHQYRGRRPKRKAWLKFLVTSRPYENIKDQFSKVISNLPQIRLMGEDRNDQIRREIDLVIQGKMDDLSSTLSLSVSTKERLTRTLLEMKNRTYLWLYLVVEEIKDTLKNSLRPDVEPIIMLSATTEKAYEKILQRGASKDRLLVKKILRIIVGARRPLSISDMAVALGVAQTPKGSRLDLSVGAQWLQVHLRDWCGLFVFINHEKLYLIHQTAKEFLIATGPILNDSAWSHCLREQEINSSMVDICVRYLAQRDLVKNHQTRKWNGKRRFEEDGLLLATDGFWLYCSEYWMEHVRSIQADRENFPTEIVLKLYDTAGERFKQWFPIFWESTSWIHPNPEPVEPDARLHPTEVNNITLAACAGHSIILKALIEMFDVDVNARLRPESSSPAHTPLTLAILFGHQEFISSKSSTGPMAYSTHLKVNFDRSPFIFIFLSCQALVCYYDVDLFFDIYYLTSLGHS